MPGFLIGMIVIVLIILVIVIPNICIVQQGRAYVIEFLGAYRTTWQMGLHVKIPFVERIARKVSLKEQVADFPPQPVITKDNVTMRIDTVVFYQITDCKLFAYGHRTPMIAIENLSTAIICAAIVGVIWIVAVPNFWRYLIPMGIIAVVAGTILVFTQSYRLTRFQVWRHPDKLDEGYQTLQGLYAIGSGGLFGRGLGQSIQKMGFIPEAQNDMIFSIICEELGLFGAIAIILLFVLLIWRFMVIANNAQDMFGALLVVGVMAHISIQVILNIAVVTNTIPNTGITLPFISYGGSSIVFLLAEMGLVLSVSRGIRLEG